MCQRPLCGTGQGLGGRSVGNRLGLCTGIHLYAGYSGTEKHPRRGAGIHSGGGSSQGELAVGIHLRRAWAGIHGGGGHSQGLAVGLLLRRVKAGIGHYATKGAVRELPRVNAGIHGPGEAGSRWTEGALDLMDNPRRKGQAAGGHGVGEGVGEETRVGGRSVPYRPAETGPM